jgi:hypothetical protein
MGWSYRKSVHFGPFRVNVSKSGIGYSVGGVGFRSGVSSRGRKYRSVSIPGTGLRYYASRKNTSGSCLLSLVIWLLAVAVGVSCASALPWNK